MITGVFENHGATGEAQIHETASAIPSICPAILRQGHKEVGQRMHVHRLDAEFTGSSAQFLGHPEAQAPS